jgi:serine/threonine protein phosphatase PrpC
MTDKFFGITDTGKVRQNNEDTFIATEAEGNRYIIACVIDGVGGYAGGEIAAELTREAILERLEKPSDDIISMAIDAFRLANEHIIAEKQGAKGHEQMSCVSTLAIADIQNNQFYYAHVGDTRLYLFRDGSLVKISHDQSFVGYLEENGRLTEAEAMNHPKRNEINKALGFESDIEKDSDYIETGQSPFLSGDLLLLCSDGLTDLVTSGEITSILSEKLSLKDKGQLLIDAANHLGGKDNITVVLVHNNKVAPKHTTRSKEKDTQPGDAETVVKKQPSTPEVNPAPVQQKSNGIVWILVVLLLIFIGISGYLYYYPPFPARAPKEMAPVAVIKLANPQEIKLQKAIDQVKGKILILSDTAFKSPVIISRAITLNKDSLTIKAKGKIVLQCDSAYKGAAMVLSPKCKSITLDSLSFANFSIGVSFANSALQLKNMRFLNCTQALRNEFALADKKYINGKLAPVVLKTDSLPIVGK